MGEYIERETLIAKFKEMKLGEHGLGERLFADGVYAVIETMPAADVAPVIRCKDCKHWGPEGESSESRVCWEMSDAVLEGYYYTPPHGYCHMAERKEGVENG